MLNLSRDEQEYTQAHDTFMAKPSPLPSRQAKIFTPLFAYTPKQDATPKLRVLA